MRLMRQLAYLGAVLAQIGQTLADEPVNPGVQAVPTELEQHRSVEWVAGTGPDSEQEERDRVRLVVQTGHTDAITSAAFSPDGRQLLTGGHDRVARLWDVASGRELRRFQDRDYVSRVAFFPDGKRVLTACYGGGPNGETALRIWDVATGNEVKTLEGKKWDTFYALSSDGRYILRGNWQGCPNLLDLASGQEIQQFSGHDDGVEAGVLSRDGRLAATASRDHTARVWEVATGKELQRFVGHEHWLEAVAFSPDGSRLATGSVDGTTRLWDVTTGKELQCIPDHRGRVEVVVFSPDGRNVLTAAEHDLVGDEGGTARLWDVATGRERRRFRVAAGSVWCAAFSPDGQQLLLGSTAKSAHLWDLDGPVGELDVTRERRCFGNRSAPVHSVVSSSDTRRFVVGRYDRTCELWDATRGSQASRHRPVLSVDISQDGRVAILGGPLGTSVLMDPATGRKISSLSGSNQDDIGAVALSRDVTHAATIAGRSLHIWDVSVCDQAVLTCKHVDYVLAVAFSPDGKHVLTGSRDKTAQLWDAGTGNDLQSFVGHTDDVCAVAFSPDGKQVVTGSWDRTTRLWDTSNGRELRRFLGHERWVSSVAFSASGLHVLTASADGTARLWDANTGKETCKFAGHVDAVESAAISRDERWILTASRDSSCRLWDAVTGRELCQVYGFVDGTWAVVDHEGRFDASNGGDVEGLHWVVGNEPIALSQLKDRYFEPGLLAKVMGFNKEPLRDVSSLKNVKLFPTVELAAPTPGNPKLGVHLVNQGGGIGRVVVLVNGKELTADARGPKPQPDAKEVDLQIDLAQDPRLVPGQQNTIEVQAYNAEGYLRSRGLKRLYDPVPEAQAAKPAVWAIVAGVSDYRGDAIDLRYATKDADDFAKALQLSAGRLFGTERVHVAALTGAQEDTDQSASRERLEKAFAAARQAKSTDILVVYLAGHGVNYGGQDGDFYYLTSDAHTADLTDPELRRATAISSNELTEWIKLIPALKQVLILDTCAAGRAVEKITEKRDVPSSQTRALERVKDRTGMFVLAGCAADRVSYEASRYGQGLLTYSLLLGMRGAALRDEQFVDVSKLFDFATDRVPELAQGIGGLQRPLQAAPTGGASFDIGQLLSEDKPQVPLQAPLPMVLRAGFQDEDRVRDHLGLSRQVNEHLREAAARGRRASLAFFDTDEFPGACELTGRYRVQDGQVTVTVLLSQGSAELARFEVSGAASAVRNLAAGIVREAETRLRAPEAQPSP